MRKWWNGPWEYASDEELQATGEETLRLQMDLEKIKIAAGLGFYFSFIIGMTILFSKFVNTVRMAFYVIVVSSIIGVSVFLALKFLWLDPSVRVLDKLASELDKRKEKFRLNTPKTDI